MRKRFRLFTLIELMVVISIIVILAALLLPALGKAREQGRRISCTGNLKTMGVALGLYEGDYLGYFPQYYYLPVTDFNRWEGQLLYYANNNISLNESTISKTAFNKVTDLDRKDMKLIICPSRKPVPSPNSRYYSYAYNKNIAETKWSYTAAIPLSKLPRPSETFLIMDFWTDDISYGYFALGNDLNNELEPPRHLNGRNGLMGDCSARSFPSDTNLRNLPKTNIFWTQNYKG